MEYLGKHPIFGVMSGVVSGSLGFIDEVTPVLQFIAVCMGIVIAGLTIYSKIKHINKENGDKDKKI